MKKFCYKCRKQVAEKRLRIKGRFVTKQQAFEMLGISSDELKSNEIIQKLLESHFDSDNQQIQLNSLVENQDGTKQIKIRNFQALIDDNYNHNSKLNSLSTASKTQSFITNSNEDTDVNTSTSHEDLLRQIQLNLRISTTNEENSLSKHVSKILIQNFPNLNGDLSIQVDESLKKSLSNLRLESYVQPLFKVEKILEAKKF